MAIWEIVWWPYMTVWLANRGCRCVVRESYAWWPDWKNGQQGSTDKTNSHATGNGGVALGDGTVAQG